jgi:hypothetical protein
LTACRRAQIPERISDFGAEERAAPPSVVNKLRYYFTDINREMQKATYSRFVLKYQ